MHDFQKRIIGTIQPDDFGSRAFCVSEMARSTAFHDGRSGEREIVQSGILFLKGGMEKVRSLGKGAARFGKTSVMRNRLTLDTESLRHRRRRVVRRLERWLEADRERIYTLAERMCEFGLYAKSTASADKISGIISLLAKINGYETSAMRNRWMLKTGWIEFWGYSGTRSKRARRLASGGAA